jgi:hypothetical protein
VRDWDFLNFLDQMSVYLGAFDLYIPDLKPQVTGVGANITRWLANGLSVEGGSLDVYTITTDTDFRVTSLKLPGSKEIKMPKGARINEMGMVYKVGAAGFKTRNGFWYPPNTIMKKGFYLIEGFKQTVFSYGEAVIEFESLIPVTASLYGPAYVLERLSSVEFGEGTMEGVVGGGVNSFLDYTKEWTFEMRAYWIFKGKDKKPRVEETDEEPEPVEAPDAPDAPDTIPVEAP